MSETKTNSSTKTGGTMTPTSDAAAADLLSKLSLSSTTAPAAAAVGVARGNPTGVSGALPPPPPSGKAKPKSMSAAAAKAKAARRAIKRAVLSGKMVTLRPSSNPKIGGLGVFATRPLERFAVVYKEASIMHGDSTDENSLKYCGGDSSLLLTMKFLFYEQKAEQKANEEKGSKKDGDSKAPTAMPAEATAPAGVFGLRRLQQQYHMLQQAPLTDEQKTGHTKQVKKLAKQYNRPEDEVWSLWRTMQAYYQDTTGYMSSLATGFALFPTSAMLNHSCDFNCILLAMPTEATLVAIRPIAVDEELTIGYHLSTRDYPFPMRQQQLRSRLIKPSSSPNKEPTTTSDQKKDTGAPVPSAVVPPSIVGQTTTKATEGANGTTTTTTSAAAGVTKDIDVDVCWCTRCEKEREMWKSRPDYRKMEQQLADQITSYETDDVASTFVHMQEAVHDEKTPAAVRKFLMFQDMFPLHAAYGLRGVADRCQMKGQEWCDLWTRTLMWTKPMLDPAYGLPPEQVFQLWQIWNLTQLEGQFLRLKNTYLSNQEANLGKMLGFQDLGEFARTVQPRIHALMRLSLSTEPNISFVRDFFQKIGSRVEQYKDDGRRAELQQRLKNLDSKMHSPATNGMAPPKPTHKSTHKSKPVASKTGGKVLDGVAAAVPVPPPVAAASAASSGGVGGGGGGGGGGMTAEEQAIYGPPPPGLVDDDEYDEGAEDFLSQSREDEDMDDRAGQWDHVDVWSSVDAPPPSKKHATKAKAAHNPFAAIK